MICLRKVLIDEWNVQELIEKTCDIFERFVN